MNANDCTALGRAFFNMPLQRASYPERMQQTERFEFLENANPANYVRRRSITASMYRGIGASLVNEAGQMALQFSLSGRLKELLSDVPAALLGGDGRPQGERELAL